MDGSILRWYGICVAVTSEGMDGWKWRLFITFLLQDKTIMV